MEAKHTPTPWNVRGAQSIRGPNGEYIAKTNWNNGSLNAAFIVRACNSHAALVEALKACAGVLSGEGMSKSSLVDALEKARAALALAGETP